MENGKSMSDAKAQAEAQDESRTADRRAFMRTMVTGTAVVGIAACTGSVEAATATQPLAQCGGPVEVPKAVVQASILLNNRHELRLDRLHEILDEVIGGSNCPTCGLGGWPPGGGGTNPGTITNVALRMAYLPEEMESMVVFTDSGSSPC
jgi:hypothetical protein